jgi:hypothetical protein
MIAVSTLSFVPVASSSPASISNSSNLLVGILTLKLRGRTLFTKRSKKKNIEKKEERREERGEGKREIRDRRGAEYQ